MYQKIKNKMIEWTEIQERMIVEILYVDKKYPEAPVETFITYIKERDGNIFRLEDLFCLSSPDNIDTDWKLEIGERYIKDYEIQRILYQMPKPPSPLDYLKENHPEYTL
jgi:hypothetical protein